MSALSRAWWCAPLFVASVTPAWAQVLSPEEAEAKRQTVAAAQDLGESAAEVVSVGSPNGRAAAGFSASSLQFAMEDGETNVSLALSFDLTDYNPTSDTNLARQGDYYRVGRTRIGLTATAPIEEGNSLSQLFAGDSFVSGSKLRLSITHFSATLGSGGNPWRVLGQAFSRCLARESANWQAAQPTGAQLQAQTQTRTLLEALQARLRPATDGSRVNFDGIFGEEMRATPLGGFLADKCAPGGATFANEGDLMRAYGEDPAAFRRQFIPDGTHVRFYGLDASVGREDHAFLDRGAFKLLTEGRTSWEVSAYAGFVSSDLTMSGRIRAVYGQSYEDRASAEICRTVSIPAGQECINGADGAPLRKRGGLVSAEFRRMFNQAEGTPIAIAPQVTYRFEDRNVGVEFPIYLAPDQEGRLSGGLKAVYNSQGDEFALGLFIGVPFSSLF